MTEPIFYCYDNECGFETHGSAEQSENGADTALFLIDEYTDDTEIHHGLMIPFAVMVEKDGKLSIENSTSDDVRESIQELDKRGLNSTANSLRGEVEFWKRKHKEDNEGLLFQLGRNLDYAQEAAYRSGATEPHPTIRCVQIIEEAKSRAESTTNDLRERLTLVDDLARKYTGEIGRLRTALMDAADALGSCDNPTDGEIDEVVAIIKKALNEP